MEASAPPIQHRPLLASRSAQSAFRADALLAWLLSFALTTYLALSGGGYDLVVRSEVGLVIWWLVLLGVIIGILPRIGLSRATWAALAVFAGFFAWTWLAAGWTTSHELTLIEVARVATYAGVFVLALCLLSRGSARPLLYGLASAIAVVCALAVLSKLIPSLFPQDPTRHLYATTRLRYPFDYSDGVGEYAALGIPLLLFVATGARSVLGRVLGAAALPVVLMCLAMTVSRGGILAAAVSLVLFFALSPKRLSAAVTALVVAAGTAVLMLALLARSGLTDRLFRAAPPGQRHSMLAILVAVVVVVGLIQAALALVARRGRRPDRFRVSPRVTRLAGLGVLAAVVAAVAIFFATGEAHRLWVEFKQPNPVVSGNTYVRLLSVAGSHRYQYWQVAIHAFEGAPWKGIGPGTFQFYWAQHQTLGESVLNAHSLWIETLAELGIIGLTLLAGFFAWVMGSGVVASLRAATEERLVRVAAVAGVGAFCAAAAFDWVWQIGVVPVVAMLLAAICVSDLREAKAAETARSSHPTTRILLGLATIVALWAVIIPLGTTVAVRQSQGATRRGNFVVALRRAADARQLEPAAASPRLQEALLLEQLGDVRGAAKAIGEAEQRAPTNWQIWLVASRIATERNRPHLALRDYLKARALNPRSPIFSR